MGNTRPNPVRAKEFEVFNRGFLSLQRALEAKGSNTVKCSAPTKPRVVVVVQGSPLVAEGKFAPQLFEQLVRLQVDPQLHLRQQELGLRLAAKRRNGDMFCETRAESSQVKGDSP